MPLFVCLWRCPTSLENQVLTTIKRTCFSGLTVVCNLADHPRLTIYNWLCRDIMFRSFQPDYIEQYLPVLDTKCHFNPWQNCRSVADYHELSKWCWHEKKSGEAQKKGVAELPVFVPPRFPFYGGVRTHYVSTW